MKRILPFVLLFFAITSFSQDQNGEIFIARIDAAISPASEAYLKRAIKSADEQNAKLLVIVLNTPGGLIQSMQTMVSDLLASPVPTVVYVHPPGSGAISAGVFITIAGNIAVMAPGTTIGAAHPVQGDGSDVGGDMREKIENTMASLGKAVSEQRDRNHEWVEKAIRESVAITDKEAKEINVIDYIARDLDDLFNQIDGKTVKQNGKDFTLVGLRSAKKVEIEPTFKQQVLFLLADPNMAVLLSVLGIGGLILEFYTPGLIAPGVIGAVCLVLSITASGVLPISAGGAVLILLGLIFFAVELLSPSFGVFGFTGIVSVLLGGIYLIDDDAVWGAPGVFEINYWMLGGIGGVMLLFLALIVFVLVSTRNLKAASGVEAMLGSTGEVISSFSYNEKRGLAEGTVLLNGERWRAISTGKQELPAKGEYVVVEEVDGLTLHVKKG